VALQARTISVFGASTLLMLCPTHKLSDRLERGADGASKFIWIEELIDIAERSASAPVYPLLKRPDERHVTMQAYDNPVFVEDMVRNVAIQLQSDPRVSWFRVNAVNHESIHNHSAFASLAWTRGASTATGTASTQEHEAIGRT